MHIKKIYTENELNEVSTIKESLIVRQEGNRFVLLISDLMRKLNRVGERGSFEELEI